MSEIARVMALYLDDPLGGMREVKSGTDWQATDNGGGEAVFNTAGQLIGIRNFKAGFTVSGTVQYIKADPSEPKYWRLRSSAEICTITLDFHGGDRVQYQGVLTKFSPQSDNQGAVTAAVEWTLGEPTILKEHA